MTSPTWAGREGVSVFLLTKTHPCFLLVPFAFRDGGISFEQPAAPAGIGPWLAPSSCLTSLWRRAWKHERAVDTVCRYITYRRWVYPLLTIHRPASTVAGSRLAAPGRPERLPRRAGTRGYNNRLRLLIFIFIDITDLLISRETLQLCVVPTAKKVKHIK